ncbi:Aste57867_19128 [Aphanomyces stellatus]|uniref:Aste57867_19128 protein n=1 Tax=Aphanomyces stellatus TaxID=120398 RepID=A0A485LBU0_9STRA|nr:hypothetical protein As57867_019064 [Aphanomyces stellatus]VFT95851.1 Aste57867_19128 [Aphanomyces stellatus]
MESNPLLMPRAAVGVKPQTAYLWLVFSAVGGMIYGYNVSIAPALPYIADSLNLSTSQQEIASASATLSDACTMLVGGFLADTLGRKTTAMAACIMSIVGAVGMLVAHSSFPAFVAWRLCTGVGNALSILVLPMYISESLDRMRRGRCIAFFQLGVLSGCVLPYIVMLAVEEWRVALGLGAVPALVVLGLFASNVFGESAPWIAWTNTRMTHDTVAHSPAATSWRITTELGLGILLAYSNNSIDPTLFYGPEIIAQTLGTFTRRSSNAIGLVLTALSVLSVGAAAVLLGNTYSRRTFYLVCHGIVVACFFVCAVFFVAFPSAMPLAVTLATLVAMATLVFFQTCGPGLLFVLIVSELFTDARVRATHMSICTFAMSAFSLAMNGTMLSLFDALGVGATFFVYGLSYAACLVVFYYYLPETSTRTVMKHVDEPADV